MKKSVLFLFALLFTSSISFAQIHVIDDFESGDLGHFKSTNPTFSGSSVGFSYADLKLDSTTAFSGSASMYFKISDALVETNWTMRFISGTGASLAQNDTLGTTGFIGLAVRAIGAGDSVNISLALDAPATAELGTPKELILDGEWRIYQWDLTDTLQWDPWLTASANGKIENPVSIDAIALFAPNGTEDVEIWIDFLSWNTGGQVPVELASFSAATNQNVVDLKWITATETNNNGFEVERKFSNGSYEKIGFVSGNGTSTIANFYSYSDAVKDAGKYSYRLKQVDFDGSFEYSKAVEVEIVALPGEYTLAQNYPNPFNPVTSISFNMPEAGMVNLAVYNLLGEKVTELVNDVRESGLHSVSFDAASLASGTYIYTLNVNGNSISKKMVLMK